MQRAPVPALLHKGLTVAGNSHRRQPRMAGSAAPFGYWRGLLWPVHQHELRKVLTMFLMFMCINFNYTLLRNTKDTLVVTAAGAEIIPFLKVWCVLPAAVAYMAVYSKASSVLSKKNLFRACIAPFMAYFLLFGLYIYPNREALHPTSSAQEKTSPSHACGHQVIRFMNG